MEMDNLGERILPNPAPTTTRRTWWLPAIAILITASVFVSIPLASPNFQISGDPLDTPFGGDFIHEYVGGYMILRGDHSRFYDPQYTAVLQHDPSVVEIPFDPERSFRIVYPPFYYLVISPLSLLPLYWSAIVWFGLMVACYLLSVGIIAWFKPECRQLWPWLLFAGALFGPLLESVISGQKGTTVLLILVSTYLLLEYRRPFTAGLVFPLLAFKPQLGLVIGLAMIAKRQWRFVAGAAATTLALIGLSLAVGLDVCRQYFELSRKMGGYIDSPGFPLEKLHCWNGFFRQLLADWPPAFVSSLVFAATALSLVVLAFLLKGPMTTHGPLFTLQFSGLVIASTLITPYLMSYDQTSLLLPMFLLVSLMVSGNAVVANQRRGLTWLVVALYLSAGIATEVAQLTNVKVSVLAMFVLLTALVRCRRDFNPAV